MTDAEIEAVVEQIKAPLKTLTGSKAEMVMMLAFFDVCVTMCSVRGITTAEGIKEHIAGAFDAYLIVKPLPETTLQ